MENINNDKLLENAAYLINKLAEAADKLPSEGMTQEEIDKRNGLFIKSQLKVILNHE